VKKLLFIFIILFFISTAKAENIYVFVSFSMPDNLMKEYAEETKQYDNATLVFRGMVDNSFNKTAIKLNEITNKQGAKAIIHPQLFDKYNIQEVPVILLEKNNGEYDKITGSVSIKYALETFKDGGNSEK
jgi:type-F conjugative transfer system pilin assembly protein TrbC